MKHIDLRKFFAGNEENWSEYGVFLAELDRVPGDDVDVIVSPLRECELDSESGQIRLYSAASRPDSAAQPLALLSLLLESLPLPGVLPKDFDVVVELPVSPADAPSQVPRLESLKQVVVGRASEEIWLLVDDPAEYPPHLLPD